jgi:hypothetical protein
MNLLYGTMSLSSVSIRPSPWSTIRRVSARLFCAVGGVGIWCELDYGLDGAIGQSGQDGGRIIQDRDIEQATALDDREDGRDLRTSFFASKVQPVAGIKSDGTHGILGEVSSIL